MFAQFLNALFIVQNTFAPAGAEDFLQFTEALVTKALGKADKRGRLHLGFAGGGGHGAKGHLIRVLECISCNLGETLRQFTGTLNDQAAQGSKVAGQVNLTHAVKQTTA